MNAFFETMHPVLAVKNLSVAIHFYTTKLGFELAFVDNA
jgi:catechol 2,3-dioxygenase-like lactoylglutathione lyase family enzyme